MLPVAISRTITVSKLFDGCATTSFSRKTGSCDHITERTAERRTKNELEKKYQPYGERVIKKFRRKRVNAVRAWIFFCDFETQTTRFCRTREQLKKPKTANAAHLDGRKKKNDHVRDF